MNTLISITGLTASDLFLNNSAAGRIEAVKAEALSLVFDTTTAKGREECISHAAKVGKTKTGIEKLGKALVDPIKAEAKVIDVERKFYKDELAALQAEVRKPVTLWEEEQSRVKAAIAQAFFELEQDGVSTSPVTGELLSEAMLSKKIQHLENVDLTEYGEDSEKAEQLAAAGLTRIKAALQQRKDADELAELRKAAAEKEAKDKQEANDKRIADEAIEKHEAAKKEAAEKLENHPVTKEIAAKGTPHVGLDLSASIKETAHSDHKRDVNRQLLADFAKAGNISEDDAKAIITEIVRGNIANIQITY